MHCKDQINAMLFGLWVWTTREDLWGDGFPLSCTWSFLHKKVQEAQHSPLPPYKKANKKLSTARHQIKFFGFFCFQSSLDSLRDSLNTATTVPVKMDACLSLSCSAPPCLWFLKQSCWDPYRGMRCFDMFADIKGKSLGNTTAIVF